MVLAIICVHNLPPHLNYVSTLPDTTQKMKHKTDELKQRLIDTWDRIPQSIIDEAINQWQTRLRACVKAKGCHFEHLVWSSHTIGSFPNRFFQSHWHCWENIPFQFLCNVWISDAKFQCNKTYNCTKYSRLQESHFLGHSVDCVIITRHRSKCLMM